MLKKTVALFEELDAFIWNRILCNIIKVFTVTFDPFNVSFFNKSVIFV